MVWSHPGIRQRYLLGFLCATALGLVGVDGSPASPLSQSRAPLAPQGFLGDNSFWNVPKFHGPLIDGKIVSSVVHQGELHIGGTFDYIGGELADGIARWDGTAWIGIPGSQFADLLEVGRGVLATYNGDLYAAYRSAAGYGIKVKVWDGVSWTDISFADVVYPWSTVTSAMEYDGDLYLAGSFTASGIGIGAVRWDGTQWLASPIQGNRILDLLVQDGKLLFCLESANQGAVGFWDGTISYTSNWYYLHPFTSLADYNGALLAGGPGEIVAFDPTTFGWNVYQTGFSDVSDMLTEAGRLYVSGEVPPGTFAGHIFAGGNMLVQEAGSWSVLGNDLDNPAATMNLFQGGVVAGGEFGSEDLNPIKNLGSWDGTEWRAFGGQGVGGFNNAVTSVVSHGGKLYVGGYFSHTGGVRTNGITAWDGTTWEHFNGGVTGGGVHAMTFHNGLLTVGGSFTGAGITSANTIAQWTGSSWTSLEANLTGEVKALAVYGGQLVAGGDLAVSGAPVGVAAWNGTSWSAIGGGVGKSGGSPQVHAFAIWDNALVVGGDFTEVGGQPIGYLAAWNGSSWEQLQREGSHPLSVTGPIQSLLVDQNQLYAGGDFWQSQDFVATWKSQGNPESFKWEPLGGGVNSAPRAMTMYGGFLMVMGSGISDAGGTPVNDIAAWDGASWSAMGSGVSNYGGAALGWALADHNGELFIGGDFQTAGGKSADRLANWRNSALGVGPGPGPISFFKLGPAHPNPFNRSSRMTLSLSKDSRVVAEVFDVRGRKLATLMDAFKNAGEHTIRWDGVEVGGSTLGGGVYFLRVRAQNQALSRRIVFIP